MTDDDANVGVAPPDDADDGPAITVDVGVDADDALEALERVEAQLDDVADSAYRAADALDRVFSPGETNVDENLDADLASSTLSRRSPSDAEGYDSGGEL